MADEPDFDLCERIDFSRSGDDGGRCIRQAGHDGDHVTFKATERTLDFWEWRNGTGTRTLHADLRPGESLGREEAAALFGYMEHIRESRG